MCIFRENRTSIFVTCLFQFSSFLLLMWMVNLMYIFLTSLLLTLNNKQSTKFLMHSIKTLLLLLIMQSGLKGPGRCRLTQFKLDKPYLSRVVFLYSEVVLCIQIRVQQAKVTASCWGIEASTVAMFWFLSPCLFTAHSAINRSHSAEALHSVWVGLWQQLPLDEGEKMACQGQNCVLISVHRRIAGLTPVPFTPKASWHYVCVLCSLSSFCLPFLFHRKGQISDTAYAIHMNSVMLLIVSDWAVIPSGKETEEEKVRKKWDCGLEEGIKHEYPSRVYVL